MALFKSNTDNRTKIMSNSINSQNQNPESLSSPHNPNDRSGEDDIWEARARAWLSTLPPGTTVTLTEVQSWLESNCASLPDSVKTTPPPQLYDWFASVHRSISSTHEEKAVIHIDPSQARFQRTDQWKPVYSWLESLDTDEVVKSKDILDWLSANPEIKEQLYLKHSRYHLMHYVKKCHVKIIKRKEKKKGLHVTNKATPSKTMKDGDTKQLVSVPCNSLINLPKDSDINMAKRNEALRKYEILLDLERELSTFFPKRESLENTKEA